MLLISCSLAGCRQLPATTTGHTGSTSASVRTGPAILPEPIVLSDEPWSYARAAGHTIRTRHYRIFTTSTDSVLRDRTAAFLEHALAHYRSAIVALPAPPRRLDTYLMATRQQWNSLTRQLMGSQASTLVRIPRGGYAARGIGVYYDIGLRDTLAVAAHEGWHQYTQRTFGNTLPVWLEEGLATYMEGHRWQGASPVFRPWANTERYDQLRTAQSDGHLLPLPALLDARPQDFLDSGGDAGLTYYAQVWALAHFLAESGDGRYRPLLGDLLRDAAGGNIGRAVALYLGQQQAAAPVHRQPGSLVFLAYFNTDLAAAAAEYERFIAKIVAVGSRDRIVAGQSPGPVAGGN